MADPTLTCPVCGGQTLEGDPEDDEYRCPECDDTWPGGVVRGEQELSYDTMAVRSEDGTYSLYELRYVNDPDTGKVVELKSGLSRAEAEKETSNVLEEPPGY